MSGTLLVTKQSLVKLSPWVYLSSSLTEKQRAPRVWGEARPGGGRPEVKEGEEER